MTGSWDASAVIERHGGVIAVGSGGRHRLLIDLDADEVDTAPQVVEPGLLTLVARALRKQVLR